jgi:hypothetical protein
VSVSQRAAHVIPTVAGTAFLMSALECGADGYGIPRQVRSVPILLQKLVVSDGCPSVIRLRATGFELPALTRSTQLPRYAVH